MPRARRARESVLPSSPVDVNVVLESVLLVIGTYLHEKDAERPAEGSDFGGGCLT